MQGLDYKENDLENKMHYLKDKNECKGTYSVVFALPNSLI